MEQESDELRYRFTAWMMTLVRRAKINYLNKRLKNHNNISLDMVPEKLLSVNYEYIRATDSTDKIEFSDEGIAASFLALSSTRQKILTMLFVREMTSEEIAAEIGCSVQNVYNQTSIALKQLRESIGKINL